MDGEMFAAVIDEAKAAGDSEMHEILRVQCDLLYQLIQCVAAFGGSPTKDWRYPRPQDKEPEQTSWLHIAQFLAGG
jgi:hypothetical protein